VGRFLMSEVPLYPSGPRNAPCVQPLPSRPQKYTQLRNPDPPPSLSHNLTPSRPHLLVAAGLVELRGAARSQAVAPEIEEVERAVVVGRCDPHEAGHPGGRPALDDLQRLQSSRTLPRHDGEARQRRKQEPSAREERQLPRGEHRVVKTSGVPRSLFPAPSLPDHSSTFAKKSRPDLVQKSSTLWACQLMNSPSRKRGWRRFSASRFCYAAHHSRQPQSAPDASVDQHRPHGATKTALYPAIAARPGLFSESPRSELSRQGCEQEHRWTQRPGKSHPGSPVHTCGRALRQRTLSEPQPGRCARSRWSWHGWL